MEIISLMIITVLIYKGLRYSLNINKYIKYFANTTKESYTNNDLNDTPEVLILMPLLREQKILSSMMDYFSSMEINPNMKMLLITTEKEMFQKQYGELKLPELYKDIRNNNDLDKYVKLFTKEQLDELTVIYKRDNFSYEYLLSYYQKIPSTIDLVKKLIPELNKRIGFEFFAHIHYPYTNGVMAHQLNYAIEKIIDSKNFNDSKTYICVYNADSKPNKETFSILLKDSNVNYIKEKEYPQVFQQIALFTQNYSSYPRTIKGYLLKASSIIQTRWSIGYESAMIDNQSKYWLKNTNRKQSFIGKLFEPITYCVGHGLFIRLDVIKNIGLFPTETLNEDLPLGYYLSLSKTPIKLFSTLESADNPNSISMLIKQKASWFWGMVDYLSYGRYASSKVKNVEKTRIIISSIKGLSRDAIAWLFCSLSLIFLSIISLTNTFIGVMFLVSLLIYTVIPSFLILKSLDRLHRVISEKDQINIFITDLLLVPFFTYFYLIVSGIGPWKSFLNLIGNKLFNIEKIKDKTER